MEIVWDRTQDLINEMCQKDALSISRVAHYVSDRLEICTPATKLLTLASILVCWLEKYDLQPYQVLGLADCLVHQGKSNNISEEFKDI